MQPVRPSSINRALSSINRALNLPASVVSDQLNTVHVFMKIIEEECVEATHSFGPASSRAKLPVSIIVFQCLVPWFVTAARNGYVMNGVA